MRLAKAQGSLENYIKIRKAQTQEFKVMMIDYRVKCPPATRGKSRGLRPQRARNSRTIIKKRT
jgi:hypothetical protein